MPEETTNKPSKPISSAQMRSLQRLSENAFRKAAVDFDRHVSDWLVSETQRIEAQRAAKAEVLEQVNESALAFKHELEQRVAKFQESMRKRGYEPLVNHYDGRFHVNVPTTWGPVGHNEALVAAKLKADRARTRGRDLLQSRKLDADRRILLASISGPEAMALVESLPTAEDILAEALVEPTKAITK